MPGKPWQWTLVALCILFLPTWVQFGLNLVKAALEPSLNAARDAVSGFYTSTVNLCFTVVFLAHQTMLALDAVARALVRRFVTQNRLLEWESAAETELKPRGRTSDQRPNNRIERKHCL